jgi:hypothetical protein
MGANFSRGFFRSGGILFFNGLILGAMLLLGFPLMGESVLRVAMIGCTVHTCCFLVSVYLHVRAAQLELFINRYTRPDTGLIFWQRLTHSYTEP